MTEFLTRAVDFEPLPEEERAAKQGDGRTLEGYAAVFDTDTEINSWEGHFKERITRGAFRKTLKERTPVLQFDHGHDSRFGSLPIGQFENIREDKHGLLVQARLFDHAEPIREAIASGAVSGMSFRFKVVRDQWHDAKGNEIKDRSELVDLLYSKDAKRGPLQRTIKEVKLMEAGPVVFPAYPQTTVGVRSMGDDDRKRAIEDMVMDGYDPSEVSEEDVERARLDALTSLIAAGYDVEYAEEVLRAMSSSDSPNAPAKSGKPAPKGKPDPNCDDCTDSKPCAKHAKTSPKGEAKPTEKKSEDDTSVAPEEGADAAESRENPDDAAQAGTSTGLSKNARERFFALSDIERTS